MPATQWYMSATSGIFLRTVRQALLLSIEEVCGLCDKGTKYQGVNTCIEHLKELWL